MVFWYWGPPGSGKSYSAAVAFPQAWISSPGKLDWFDGYHGQEAVIFDDLRAPDINFNYLLRLLDNITMKVPVKGGFVLWYPKLIIITCPRLPEQEFVNHETGCVYEDIGQLTRRVTGTVRFDRRDDTYECVQMTLTEAMQYMVDH